MPRKKFSAVAAATMSSESLSRARARTQEMLAEMPLQELRRARTLSQATLAQFLGANQPQISKIENSTDLYVSTLRRYVEAMGGELDIVARFPEGSVRVTQFGSIEPAAEDVSESWMVMKAGDAMAPIDISRQGHPDMRASNVMLVATFGMPLARESVYHFQLRRGNRLVQGSTRTTAVATRVAEPSEEVAELGPV